MLLVLLVLRMLLMLLRLIGLWLGVALRGRGGLLHLRVRVRVRVRWPRLPCELRRRGGRRGAVHA